MTCPWNIQIGDVVVSAKGAKIAPITANGSPVYWQPKDALEVVFPPGSYQDDGSKTRLTVTLKPTSEQIYELTELDEKILQLCSGSVERLFGKTLSEGHIRERNQGALRLSDKYPANTRVKMNTTGPGAVRYWKNGVSVEAPDNWVNASVRPVVRVKSLWLMAGSFGVLLEMTDAQVTPEEKACPF
jgi:hypothetical protein